MNKKGGQPGNQNAAKDEKKESFVQLRIEREVKARWVEQARQEGKNLATWITEKCNQ